VEFAVKDIPHAPTARCVFRDEHAMADGAVNDDAIASIKPGAFITSNHECESKQDRKRHAAD
jgi:hypothetical protein